MRFDNNQNITYFKTFWAHYHKNKNIQRRRSELNIRAKLTKELFLHKCKSWVSTCNALSPPLTIERVAWRGPNNSCDQGDQAQAVVDSLLDRSRCLVPKYKLDLL